MRRMYDPDPGIGSCSVRRKCCHLPSDSLNAYQQVEAVIWQTTALTNERNDIDIMRRRLEANVLLIKAPGWRMGHFQAASPVSFSPAVQGSVGAVVNAFLVPPLPARFTLDRKKTIEERPISP